MKIKKILLCFVLVTVLIAVGNMSVFAVMDNDNIIIAETTGGAVETPAPAEEPDPPSIIIQDYPATIDVGESTRLSYVLRNSDTEDITWKSSAPDVLSIDDSGKITANAPGTAKITVTAANVSDSITITVKIIQAESMEIVSDDFGLTDAVTGHKIKKGDVVRLQVKVKPKESTVSGITWAVDDEDIAEIDSGGTLVALKSGKVTVTASADNGLEADVEIQIGSDIPWALIAIVAAIVIIIIILITLIIKKKMRGGSKPKKSSKHDYDDDDDDDHDDEDEEDKDKKRQEELEKEKERIRQEAYRQGFADRDKEMTKVFDPKDFQIKDDDEIE